MIKRIARYFFSKDFRNLKNHLMTFSEIKLSLLVYPIYPSIFYLLKSWISLFILTFFIPFHIIIIFHLFIQSAIINFLLFLKKIFFFYKQKIFTLSFSIF